MASPLPEEIRMRTPIAVAAVVAMTLAGCATPPAAPPPTAGNVDAKAAFAKLLTLSGDWEGGIGTPDGPNGVGRFYLGKKGG